MAPSLYDFSFAQEILPKRTQREAGKLDILYTAKLFVNRFGDRGGESNLYQRTGPFGWSCFGSFTKVITPSTSPITKTVVILAVKVKVAPFHQIQACLDKGRRAMSDQKWVSST